MQPKRKLRLYGKESSKTIDELIKGKISREELPKARNDIQPELLAAYPRLRLEDSLIEKTYRFKGFLDFMLSYCFIPVSSFSSEDHRKETFNVGLCTELYKESDDPNQDTMFGRMGKHLDTSQLVDVWLEDIKEYMRLDNSLYSLNLKKKTSEDDIKDIINPKILTKDDYAFALFYNYGIGNKSDFIQRFKLILEEKDAARKIVTESIEAAIKRGSSDVHIAPFNEKMASVRLRTDGNLSKLMDYPIEKQPAVINIIKGMAGTGMDIAETRLPQDGKFKSGEVDVRVATSRTQFGQMAVLRFAYGSSAIGGLNDLGISNDNLGRAKALFQDTNGIFLVTGPTGSGKSATLAAVLEYIVKITQGQKNILTVENPVENVVAGTNQHLTYPPIGLNFPEMLRAFLREDPDVIMLGEIRDKETAEIAVQAALTGHLVFSTLHTNDSVQGINRLQTWGLESYVIGDTLRGVMSQRLIRKICEKCNTLKLSDEERNNMTEENYFKSGKGSQIAKFYMTPEEKRKALRRFIV